MDPLTSTIVTLLGKYAVDKGASLLKEAGQAAAEAAGKLFQKVMDRLKADPTEAKNAERFEQNPEGYQAPIADAVDEKVKSDPDFAAELKALLAEFEQAKSAASVAATSAGSGAAAAGGGVAAGEGGIAAGAGAAAAGAGGVAAAINIGGSAGGGISVGSNTPSSERDRKGE